MPKERRTVTHARVVDIEKRRFPSKHYVYVIEVTWSDGLVNVIYRRYSRFFDLQCKLLDKFPYEAGTVDPADRIIPFIPGKILFGRSQIRDVAEKRKQPLSDYCQALMKLPAKISECKEIVEFFEATPEDVNPSLSKKGPSASKGETISDPLRLDRYVAIADYQREESNEVSLTAGMTVEVIEKNENGWWFVSVEEEQGWVPSTYLEKEDGTEEDRSVVKSDPGKEDKYLCTHSYEPAFHDEVRLEKGCIVDVLEKNLDGWWHVRFKDKEGWAPAAYLERADTLRQERLQKIQPAQPVQIISNMMQISTLKTSTAQSQNGKTSQSETNHSFAGSGRLHETSTGQSQHRAGLGLRSGDSASASSDEKRWGNKLNRTGAKSSPQLGQRKQPVPRKNSIVGKKKPSRPPPPKRKSEYMTTDDFQERVPNSVSFSKGEKVEVIEKNQSGWWFVKINNMEGWVPSDRLVQISSSSGENKTSSNPQASQMKALVSDLQKTSVESSGNSEIKTVPKVNRNGDSTKTDFAAKLQQNLLRRENNSPAREIHNEFPDETAEKQVENCFVAIADFETEETGELSLIKGQEVTVVENSDSGWWLVSDGTNQGWTPSSYLEGRDPMVYENITACKNTNPDLKSVKYKPSHPQTKQVPSQKMKSTDHQLKDRGNSAEASVNSTSKSKPFVGIKPTVPGAKPKISISQSSHSTSERLLDSAQSKKPRPVLPNKSKASPASQDSDEEMKGSGVSKLRHMFEQK